jgi:KipI family sensor histidine kinase inhibitor
MTDWSAEPYGPQAWLVRFGRDLSEETMARALALARELEANPPEGLREFTMGYASVLVECRGDAEAAVRWGRRTLPGLIEEWRSLDLEETASRMVEIPVVYDGEDLSEVARLTGLDEREVIARHSGRDYRVWLLGFAPGFPYLGVLDEALHLPRRATPRPRIASGSVAIAGGQTGIYPSESAGGWHILGRTSRKLFDPQGKEPFLLRPGDTVRFVAAEAADG